MQYTSTLNSWESGSFRLPAEQTLQETNKLETVGTINQFTTNQTKDISSSHTNLTWLSSSQVRLFSIRPSLNIPRVLFLKTHWCSETERRRLEDVE